MCIASGWHGEADFPQVFSEMDIGDGGEDVFRDTHCFGLPSTIIYTEYDIARFLDRWSPTHGGRIGWDV